MGKVKLKFYKPEEILGASSLYDGAAKAAEFLMKRPSSSAREVSNGIGRSEINTVFMLTDLTTAQLAVMDTKEKGTTKEPRYSLAKNFEARLQEINGAISASEDILIQKYRTTYTDAMEVFEQDLIAGLESLKRKPGKPSVARSKAEIPVSKRVQ